MSTRLLLLALAAAVAAQDVDKTEDLEKRGEKLSAWQMAYYLDPEPDKVAWALREKTALNGWQGKKEAPALGFFTAVFEANPDRVAEWAGVIGEMPAEARKVSYRALWCSGSPQSLKVLMEAKEENAALGKMIAAMIARPPPKWKTVEVTRAQHVDFFWGAFFASGKKEYVLQVVSVLRWDPSEIAKKKDLVRITVRGAAVWSLTALARQQEAVYRICKAHLEKAAKHVKPEMAKIVAGAREQWEKVEPEPKPH